MAEEKKRPVSPINGQPLPRGRPFTSETAREARRIREERDKERQSITEAFKKLMAQDFEDGKGNTLRGAEIIAEAIMKYAAKGNPKMVEIGLALIGETPIQKIAIQNGQLAELIDGLREPVD